MLYPKMILAHALHRVTEEGRGHFPDVDRLISRPPFEYRNFKKKLLYCHFLHSLSSHGGVHGGTLWHINVKVTQPLRKCLMALTAAS
jgi:hypothetical protein